MIPAIAALLPLVGNVIDKVLPNPQAKADAKQKLAELAQSGELRELETVASIIRAEAESESWITRSWRPITMLVFVAIVANNYIIYPYLSLFWGSAPLLELPERMWDLLTIGIGGYVVGRSAVQGVKAWKA